MPHPYGSDIAGALDIGPSLAIVEGVPVLRDALIRRLATKLPWDIEYGLPLDDFINMGLSSRDALNILTLVENELSKDERVLDVRVSGGLDDDGETVRMTVEIDASDGTTFSFTGELGTSGFSVSL